MRREMFLELGICGLATLLLTLNIAAFAQRTLFEKTWPFGIASIVFIVLFTVVLLRYSETPEDSAVRSALGRYRSMLDNLPVGVYRATSNGKILEANKTFVKILGYESADELKQVNLNDIFVRKSDRVGQIEKMENSTVFAEFQLRRKSGETVWVRDYPKATLAPTGYVNYMDGVIVQTHGIEAIVRDITEHRKLEIMKDQFVSAVTHELRTPLVSIKGYIDYVLAEDQETPVKNVRSSLDVVKRNTDRLLALTDDLLDAQRMESGKLGLRILDVNFRDLLEECVEEIQPLLKQRRQHLHFEIPQGPLTIQGDHVRLVQAVMNLLNNATKFTPDGGNITVEILEVKQTGDLQVSIRDTGIGITKGDLVRVFEPFAAIEKPTYYKGTGLGLSLTKKIIESHGGTIAAFSAGKEQGTTFTFNLPRKRMVEVHG